MITRNCAGRASNPWHLQRLLWIPSPFPLPSQPWKGLETIAIPIMERCCLCCHPNHGEAIVLPLFSHNLPWSLSPNTVAIDPVSFSPAIPIMERCCLYCHQHCHCPHNIFSVLSISVISWKIHPKCNFHWLKKIFVFLSSSHSLNLWKRRSSSAWLLVSIFIRFSVFQYFSSSVVVSSSVVFSILVLHVWV